MERLGSIYVLVIAHTQLAQVILAKHNGLALRSDDQRVPGASPHLDHMRQTRHLGWGLAVLSVAQPTPTIVISSPGVQQTSHGTGVSFR